MRDFNSLKPVTSDYFKTAKIGSIGVVHVSTIDNDLVVVHGESAGAYIQGRMRPMLGCCGAVEISDITSIGLVTPTQLYQELLLSLATCAKIAGYSLVTYTTIPAQSWHIRALEAARFTPVLTFSSQRTGNDITLWTKVVATKESEAKVA